MATAEATVFDRDALLKAQGKADSDIEVLSRLDAFGMTLCELRSEAIDGRQVSGIEDDWIEDEEYYEGIDDANRREFSAWRSKPIGQAEIPESQTTGSTIFLNVTRPYVDSSAARIGEMLLPADDRGWEIGPTPIPDLALVANGQVPRRISRDIRRQFAPGQQGDGQAQTAEAQLIEKAREEYDHAVHAASLATARIDDWHVECQMGAVQRQVIEDTARIGTGVIKGPVPANRRNLAFNAKDQTLIVKESIQPQSRWVDPWNFYPDPGCGQNIHDGSFTWERDDVTRKKLDAMRGLPGVVDEQIDVVLREGPSQATKEVPDRPDHLHTADIRRAEKNLFEIWYYHGEISRDALMAAKVEGADELDGSEVIQGVCTMVNNRVIRASLNPMDTGDFPYDVMVWQARNGMPWGIGVSRQMRVAQRIINGGARNLMDNAGRSGGPQVIMDPDLVEPENGQHEIAPWKIWFVAAAADLENIDKAFRFVVPPPLIDELQSIIYMGLKLAEDITGLPALLQGQTGNPGTSTPRTLGQSELLQNNANIVARRMARLWDDKVTEPHIRRYYRYLLQYGEDEEKGDFQINARGSSALVERAIQSQSMMMMAQLVENPVYGIDPKKYAEEWLKSQRLAPRRFQFDDQTWAQTVAKLAEGPKDTTMEVAQLKVQSDQFREQMKAKLQELDHRFQSGEKDKDRQLELLQTEIESELEAAKIAGKGESELNRIKAKLADTVMKLRTQERLSVRQIDEDDRESRREAHTAIVTKPPTEPAGRAKAGSAYQG